MGRMLLFHWLVDLTIIYQGFLRHFSLTIAVASQDEFIAVFALVAVFASQSEAWIQTTEICTAYFKAIGVVTDPSTLPVGQMWEDKVCVQDPSFYLSCKLFNGVISGELQQCPPGKLFDQHAVKP